MDPLVYRKSSYSGQQNNCVEVADLPDNGRAVRDSKRVDSPVLTFNAAEWRAFVQGIRAGEFD